MRASFDRAAALALHRDGSGVNATAEALGVKPRTLREYLARGRRGEGSPECQKFSADWHGIDRRAEAWTRAELVRALEDEAREDRGSERRQRARVLLLRRVEEEEAAAKVPAQTPLQKLMAELNRRKEAPAGEMPPLTIDIRKDLKHE